MLLFEAVEPRATLRAPPAPLATADRAGSEGPRELGRLVDFAPVFRIEPTTWSRYDRSLGRQSGPRSRQPMIASVKSRETSGRRSESGVGRSPVGLRPESIS